MYIYDCRDRGCFRVCLLISNPRFTRYSFGSYDPTSRVFSKAGYRVALIARNADSLNKFASELNSQGGEASTTTHSIRVIPEGSSFVLISSFPTQVAAFPIKEYSYKDIHSAFASIHSHFPDSELRAALWNAGYGVWKPFLELTEEEVTESVQTNVTAAFSFAREVVLAFKELPLNELGKRGTLVFTGATASLRGNTTVGTWFFRSVGVLGSYLPLGIYAWLIWTTYFDCIYLCADIWFRCW